LLPFNLSVLFSSLLFLLFSSLSFFALAFASVLFFSVLFCSAAIFLLFFFPFLCFGLSINEFPAIQINLESMIR